MAKIQMSLKVKMEVVIQNMKLIYSNQTNGKIKEEQNWLFFSSKNLLVIS